MGVSVLYLDLYDALPLPELSSLSIESCQGLTPVRKHDGNPEMSNHRDCLALILEGFVDEMMINIPMLQRG